MTTRSEARAPAAATGAMLLAVVLAWLNGIVVRTVTVDVQFFGETADRSDYRVAAGAGVMTALLLVLGLVAVVSWRGPAWLSYLTGAASGIGAACARQLAAKGATVVVADLQADKGEALAAEIKGVFAQVDVTNTEQITAAVNAAAEIAPLRAVVNSAGIGWAQRTIGRDGLIESAHDLGAFTKVIQINLIGTFDMVRQAATVMSRNEPDADGQRGAIVNLASVAAFDGQIGQASYSASKGGVVGMTLPVARDLSASGIRLNTIAPGLIDTPIYGEGPDSEAFKAKLGESVLFPKRLGVPDELASMVVECLTNSYMNAEVIRVDGGIRMPPK